MGEVRVTVETVTWVFFGERGRNRK